MALTSFLSHPSLSSPLTSHPPSPLYLSPSGGRPCFSSCHPSPLPDVAVFVARARARARFCVLARACVALGSLYLFAARLWISHNSQTTRFAHCCLHACMHFTHAFFFLLPLFLHFVPFAFVGIVRFLLLHFIFMRVFLRARVRSLW